MKKKENNHNTQPNKGRPKFQTNSKNSKLLGRKYKFRIMQDINHQREETWWEGGGRLDCQNTKYRSIVKVIMSSKGIQYLGQSTKKLLRVMRTLIVPITKIRGTRKVQTVLVHC